MIIHNVTSDLAKDFVSEGLLYPVIIEKAEIAMFPDPVSDMKLDDH